MLSMNYFFAMSKISIRNAVPLCHFYLCDSQYSYALPVIHIYRELDSYIYNNAKLSKEIIYYIY